MTAATHAQQDLYEVLGVPRSCDADTLKAAWRATARRTHPDTGGSAADFERAHHAWQVLADPLSRAEYDRGLRVRDLAQHTRPSPSRPTATAAAAQSAASPNVSTASAPTVQPSTPRVHRTPWRSGLVVAAAIAGWLVMVFQVAIPDWFVQFDALTQTATSLQPWTPVATALLVLALAGWLAGLLLRTRLGRVLGAVAVPVSLATVAVAAGPLLISGLVTVIAAGVVLSSFALALRVIGAAVSTH